MLASEVIRHLQEHISRYGDLEVVDEYDNVFTGLEYNTDGNKPAFVAELTPRDRLF